MKNFSLFIIFLFFLFSVSGCHYGGFNFEDSNLYPENSPLDVTKESDVVKLNSHFLNMQDTKVFKLSTINPQTYPVSQALEKFSNETLKRSIGDIEIQLYYDGVIGNESDCMEGIKLKTLEMSLIGGSEMISRVPEYELLALPFAIKSREHLWSVLNGKVGKTIMKKAEEHGFKIVCFFDEGARNIYHRSRFIETPSDLKGVFIRTLNSNMVNDCFREMGAIPSPTDPNRLYMFLEQGSIDAAENNFPYIYLSKQFEVSKFLTETAHLRTPSALVMNLDVWNSLDDGTKKILEDASNIASKYGIDEFEKEEEKFLRYALDEGAFYKALTDEQRQQFIDKCKPIYNECMKNFGSDLVNSVLNGK